MNKHRIEVMGRVECTYKAPFDGDEFTEGKIYTLMTWADKIAICDTDTGEAWSVLQGNNFGTYTFYSIHGGEKTTFSYNIAEEIDRYYAPGKLKDI